MIPECEITIKLYSQSQINIDLFYFLKNEYLIFVDNMIIGICRVF